VRHASTLQAEHGKGEHGGSPLQGIGGRVSTYAAGFGIPRGVIATSESPTRRSNPLNRVAQENLRQGRPLIPKGVVTSCLSALLAMTTWGTQRKRTTGRAESGVISNSQGHCRVAPSGLLAITTPDRLTQGDRRRECLCPSMVLAQSPRGLPRYACGTSPNHNLFGEVACSHS